MNLLRGVLGLMIGGIIAAIIFLIVMLIKWNDE